MTRVLFVCVKNAGKSQMAAGLLRDLITPGEPIEVESAGTQAGEKLNADSVAALAELGIDITDHEPRQLTDRIIAEADLVITVGGNAQVEQLPGPRYERWDIDEPSLRGITGPERMRLVRDDIARHVTHLHHELIETDTSSDRRMVDRDG